MKNLFRNFAFLLSLLLLTGCGNSEADNSEKEKTREEPKTAMVNESTDPMDNKGIGPITSVELNATIDEGMATRGAELFQNLCSACHKFDKKFVGPALSGVTERRSPEWIMNMVLNPEQMIKEDPIAKKLLIESNMAVMADQNLEEDEARAILEYFRKYNQEN